MTLFSFIICSHRAPESLLRTLDSLLAQEGRESAEVVIVNNGFDPARERLLLEKLEGSIQTVMVKEPTPGLGFARRRGFAAANGVFLVLLDDDNYLGPGFLSGLQEIVRIFPDVGGICPLVQPDWEAKPGAWLMDFGRYCLSYNAAGCYRPDFDERHWKSGEACLRPPGGGMIIHHKVAQRYLASVMDPRRIALSRQPDSLVGCEDEDIYSNVFALELATVFSDRLKVFHMIPSYRTRFLYLANLNYQMLYSFGVLQRLRGDQVRVTAGKALWELVRSLRHFSLCVLTGKVHLKRGVIEVIRKAGLLQGHRYGSP